MKKTLAIAFLLSTVVLSACQFPARNETGCGPSTLKIGDAVYEIKTIKPRSDGSLPIPTNEPAIAYWVDGTATNQVFALSPTQDNLALEASLEAGDTVTVAEDCNSATYILSGVETEVPENLVLLDQSTSQVTIFVWEDTTGTGFMVKGELAEETINAFNTPDSSAVQAEISLLEVSPSEDGETVRIAVSILNFGASSFSISSSDVALVSMNTVSSTPASAEPALPVEIEPGESREIQLTFPRPASPSATLKILGVEYEIEGY